MRARSRRSADDRLRALRWPRPASDRTSAAECSQPGLPVHALIDSQGEFSSNTRPIGASTRSATSATPSSRSKTSTERHGVMTIGALIAARYSATRAFSTPNGTAAPRATRPSFCSIHPTGPLVTGGQVAPGCAVTAKPVRSCSVSVELADAPACSAASREPICHRHQRANRVRYRQPYARIPARQQ